MHGFFFSAVLLILMAMPTSAVAINYISQLRSVDATAFGNPDRRENSTLGFWTDTADISHITAAFPPVVLASGFASQASDLSDKWITMSGSLSASALESYAGNGQSELSIQFSVDSPSPYVSQLSTSGSTQTSIDASEGWNPTGSGTLSPGAYSLSIVFDVAASGGSFTDGTYLFSLHIVPEPSTATITLLGSVPVVLRRTRRRWTDANAEQFAGSSRGKKHRLFSRIERIAGNVLPCGG